MYKLIVLLVIFLLLVGGCRRAGSWLVKTDHPEHADAMIMLMGRIPDRVLQIADLYDEQVSGKVWIVEEGMGSNRVLEERGVQLISNTSQVRSALISLGIPADSLLILPCGANSTRMEAATVRDHLITRSDVDTLLLVSSSVHMRRAFKVFRAALKPLENPPVVYCSPSPYTVFQAEKWWRRKEDIQRVLMEYVKLVNFALFEKKALPSGTPSNK
jgi:uncharacterized SAM-binding protein YcdF (DUF218 family)